MIGYEGFSLLILFLIIAPIIGAFALLFLFLFEERIDLLKLINKEIVLEKELQQAQYNELNKQIQPHFLFNTLNAILSLARLGRTTELVPVLESLSFFLRYKYKTDEPLMPFSQEIQYTEHYLQIQKIRFGTRLKVELACDPEVLPAYTPPYILQTLVENAFKHGLEHKIGESLLSIRLFVQNQSVYIEVINNGAESIASESKETSGHGLENIRRRLYIYFGEQANVEMESFAADFTIVKVVHPLLHSSQRKEILT